MDMIYMQNAEYYIPIHGYWVDIIFCRVIGNCVEIRCAQDYAEIMFNKYGDTDMSLLNPALWSKDDLE